MDNSEIKQQQDFLINWLPGCNEMIKKALPNSGMLYYPPSDNSLQLLKVFDFTSQNSLGEDDDFVSIETKSSSTTKSKTKVIKKSKETNYTTQSKSKQQKTYTAPLPKFKISQTINPANDWKVIADFNKLTLEKLQFDSNDVVVEDKLLLGNIYQITDEIENKISVYNPLQINHYDNMKFFGNITTLEDEKIKTATDIGNVFVTDKILSVIMTCNYSSHPWHLKATKLGDNVYFDKMENSEIDLVTVDESDNQPFEDDDNHINSYKSLAIEATLINEFIKEMIIELESPKATCDGPNPFMEESEKVPVEHLGYRYRVWKMDDIEVLVRCQVHSYVEGSDNNNEGRDDDDDEDNEENEDGDENKIKFVNIYALNEYNSNSYLGGESNLFHSLIKKELTKNHLKLTKWGVNCYLGGVDKMMIGFVTRKNTKDNNSHLVSGFYNINSSELLQITNFNKNIGWGILKELVEIIRKQKDGAFIITKTLGATGAKSMIRLYSVPESTFTKETEEEDDY